MVQAAAIYCRISKDDAGQGAGVKRQEADGRAYAEHKGWPVAEVYVDNDVSGWSGVPPGFDRMLDDVAAQRRDAVVIYNVDRLTRQPILFERFLETCQKAGVRKLGSIGGDIDLATSDGQFMARVLVAQAKKSSDDTSRRIRRAFDEKAANGQWKRGGLRPYGYVWDDDAGTIVPHEPEAELIREGARRVLAGESRRGITLDWHARGLRTSQGKPWSITRLAEVLRSPTIVAKRIHRGEVVGDGAWEPILDAETWNAVNRKVKRQAVTARPGRQRHLLSGIAECGVCGRPMQAKSRPNREGDGRRTYTCQSDSADRCGKVRVIAGPLERIVLDTAWEWFEPGEVKPADFASPETAAIDDRLAELADVEADLAAARREGIVTSATFLRELQTLSDERADIERRRQKIEKGAGGVVLTPDQFQTLSGPPETLAGARSDVVEFWRGVVGAVFEKVTIHPAGKGRRFSPDRIVLHPREGFESARLPVILPEGQRNT